MSILAVNYLLLGKGRVGDFLTLILAVDFVVVVVVDDDV